jgi:hypothetical protein
MQVSTMRALADALAAAQLSDDAGAAAAERWLVRLGAFGPMMTWLIRLITNRTIPS